MYFALYGRPSPYNCNLTYYSGQKYTVYLFVIVLKQCALFTPAYLIIRNLHSRMFIDFAICFFFFSYDSILFLFSFSFFSFFLFFFFFFFFFRGVQLLLKTTKRASNSFSNLLIFFDRAENDWSKNNNKNTFLRRTHKFKQNMHIFFIFLFSHLTPKYKIQFFPCLQYCS